MEIFFNSLISLIVLVYLTLSTKGAGDILWKIVSREHNPINFPLSYFLGFVFYSNLFILLSVVTKYPINLLLTLIISILTFTFWVKKLRSNQRPLKERLQEVLNNNKTLLVIPLFLALSILFFHSLVENTGWDEVVYHFPVVREISNGGVRFPLLQDSAYRDFYQPFSKLYGSFPYAAESFASFGYSLSGHRDNFVTLVFFANYIFLLIYLRWFMIGVLKLQTYTYYMAAVLITLSKSFSGLLSTAYVDINVAIFEFLALTLYLYAFALKKERLYILASIFLAFSLGIKYSAVYFLLSLAPLLVLIVYQLVKRGKLIKCLYLFLLGIASGGFWYLKNLLFFYNPVFPFVYGGKGVSKQELDFITSTQTESRVTLNVHGLLDLFQQNYETLLIVIVSVLVIATFRFYRKAANSNIVFYLSLTSAISFLLNYFFGNQSSRYILISNLLTYILVAKFTSINKMIVYVVVILSILNVFSSNELRGMWNSRIKNVYYSFLNKTDTFYRSNIGCVYDVVGYLNSDGDGAKAINLWDPYSAVYYQRRDTFVRFSETDVSELEKLMEVGYVYVNNQYKRDFLSTKNFHSDMDIDYILSIENKLVLNKMPVFSQNNCLLYKI